MSRQFAVPSSPCQLEIILGLKRKPTKMLKYDAAVAWSYSNFTTIGLALLFVFLIRAMKSMKTSRSRKGYKAIPGPTGYPIVGNVPQIGARPFESFQRMRSTYGDVFMVHLMTTPVLVLNSHQAIRDAFLGQSFVFAGRPSFPSWKKIANGHSLTFSPFTECWRAQKKLSGHALFLMNSDPSRPLDRLLEQHGDALVARLQQEHVSDPHPALLACISDVIFAMMFGESGTHEKAAKEVLQYFDDFREIFDAVQMSDAMPMFAQVFLRKTLNMVSTVTTGIDRCFEAMLNDYSNEYDGYIKTTADAYLKVASEIPDEGLPNGLSKQHITDSMQDIVGAALETTVHTLYFAVRYMLQHPDVQARVQHDIDSVLGRDVPVSWEHRSKLPYVHATITEILRHSCVLPLTIPHCTTQDTVFRGHAIAKGTMVFGNIYSASFDEQVWESPHQFLPERFLTASGEFDKQRMSKLCMFGLGKRRCLGEAIANKMLFVIFAKMLQQCSFTQDQPVTSETRFMLSLCPVPFSAKVLQRAP